MDNIPVEIAAKILCHAQREDLPSLNLLSPAYHTLVRNDPRFALTARFECSRYHAGQMAKMAEIAQHARRNNVKLKLQFYVGRFNEGDAKVLHDEAYNSAIHGFVPLLEACLDVVVHLDFMGPDWMFERVMRALASPARALRSMFLCVDNTGYQSLGPWAPTIPTDIFAGSAPRLQFVELAGIHLGSRPIPGFRCVNVLEMALDSLERVIGASVISAAAPAVRNFKFSFLPTRTELEWNQLPPTMSQLGVDLAGTDLSAAEFAHWGLKHPSLRLVGLLPTHALSNARRLVLRYSPDALAISTTTEHWAAADDLSVEVLSLRHTVKTTQYSSRTFNFGIVLRNSTSEQERVVLPERLHHQIGSDTDIFAPLAGVAHRLGRIRINLDYLPMLLSATGHFAAATVLDVCLTGNWENWPQGLGTVVSPNEALWTSAFPALQLVRICGASELEDGCRVASRMLGYLGRALGLDMQEAHGARLVLDYVDVDSQNGDAHWRDQWVSVFHTKEGLYVVDAFVRQYDPLRSVMQRRRPTVHRPRDAWWDH